VHERHRSLHTSPSRSPWRSSKCPKDKRLRMARRVKLGAGKTPCHSRHHDRPSGRGRSVQIGRDRNGTGSVGAGNNCLDHWRQSRWREFPVLGLAVDSRFCFAVCRAPSCVHYPALGVSAHGDERRELPNVLQVGSEPLANDRCPRYHQSLSQRGHASRAVVDHRCCLRSRCSA
jgi:hypothetical protein